MLNDSRIEAGNEWTVSALFKNGAHFSPASAIAQNTHTTLAWPLLSFEKFISLVCQTALKIRVSMVRFRPRPPLSKPNPSRLGFFTSVLSPHCAGILPILRVPQAISRRPESAHRPAKFDSFLVSVLKKSARTSPAEHTHKPSCDKQLPLMRRIGFDAWTTYCNSRTR